MCLQFLRKVFIFVAALLAPVFPVADAAAEGRRARLSDDLVQRLQAGDTAGDTVIVTGSQAQVSAVAARHGLAIRKRLKTGAVLDVPAGALDALSRDREVDQLSGNYRLRSHMAVTNAAIGADQVWEGVGGLPGVTGRGIGVAVIDSGIAEVPALRGRIVVSVDFTDRARARRSTAMATATHVAGIVAAAGSRHDDTTAAWRRARI